MDNLTDIILDNEKLIYSIIKKYQNYYEIDDLYQVAVIGMIKAYKKYNDSFKTKFTTYAYTYILGELFKYINDCKTIKLNKECLVLGKKIEDAKNVLTQKLMKEPSVYELAIYLEIDEKLINEVIIAKQKVDSLDKIICEDGKNIFLYDLICDKKNIDYLDSIYVNNEIEKLTKEEQELIKVRYYQDKTQNETASYFGINQVQVSRNEQKILKKLRDNFQNIKF